MKRRIDQILGNFGYCSRWQARRWINEGRISHNGVVLTDFSSKVEPRELLIDGEPIAFPDGMLILLNKPLGYVCSHESGEGPRVYDLLPPRWQDREPKVVSIGRLDKDTSGLLLLTDQSALVQRWTSPKHHVEKVYRATLDRELDPGVIGQFAAGIALRGEAKVCLPAALTIIDAKLAEVTLSEGRYHQVRRMFAACGYQVEALHRQRFGDIELGDLPEGQWRALPLPAAGS
ncbi:rRNA pseudouridine synthase [Permianibacter sp. IMCC34836]|uniref:pseudouridine synthase n=1 Tax=Permianibacter fluminis TaxID=2738515 RepID=UPI0015582DEA|nr:pseudouridine synthase [Permianibacter fluminis]NQD37671.1 rRNA pseudouridine synthase [Permianibacter fluminis]